MRGAATKRLLDALGARTNPYLRAYARPVFGTSALEGLLLLVATLESPAAGAFGLLAVLVAHGVASAAGYAEDGVASGYYGYNALLVGLALGEAGPPSAKLALLVVGGATVAVLLAATLGDFLSSFALPVVALPFVLVTSFFWHTALDPGAQPFWLAPGPPAAEAPLAETVLKALGAIILRPTVLGGALVLAAIVLRSRITAVALVAGAVIGVGVVRGLGSSDPALVVPAAYNAALTFAALGAAFYVPGRAAVWVAAGASALTAWLSAALMLPFAPLAIPVLAWPFVLVTLCVMRGLGLRAPGRAPFLAPLPAAPPEVNLDYARTFATRLGLPGPPRFVLPMRGPWRVTQGVDGSHTHQGPWRHALDFEIVDQEGFPFRSSGTAAADYYCFGQPVLAPGAGVVVAVHDGAADNVPGEQDLARPWGNAVVIQHGPALFSIIAHLRQGSVAVVPGQQVVAGEPVAQCGSSGRSPRPHLHFQAQASAALGAPTLDFRMVHYVAAGQPPRFDRLGVPAEGETVQTPQPAPLPTAGSKSFPPPALALFDARHRPTTLRHEVTLFGENALVDSRRDERLFFVPHAAGVLFTALRGSPDGLLGAILQIAPYLPAVATPRFSFVEELLPGPLLPLPLRPLHRLLGVFAEPASAKVRGELGRSGDFIVVESLCEVRFLGRVVRRRFGRLELDKQGLASVELWPAGGGRAVAKFGRHSFAPPFGERNSEDGEVPTCAV
jgi:urea transporter